MARKTNRWGHPHLFINGEDHSNELRPQERKLFSRSWNGSREKTNVSTLSVGTLHCGFSTGCTDHEFIKKVTIRDLFETPVGEAILPENFQRELEEWEETAHLTDVQFEYLKVLKKTKNFVVVRFSHNYEDEDTEPEFWHDTCVISL